MRQYLDSYLVKLDKQAEGLLRGASWWQRKVLSGKICLVGVLIDFFYA